MAAITVCNQCLLLLIAALQVLIHVVGTSTNMVAFVIQVMLELLMEVVFVTT